MLIMEANLEYTKLFSITVSLRTNMCACVVKQAECLSEKFSFENKYE